MDINRRRPVRITAEIMDRYESEPEKRVFEGEITKMRFLIQNIQRFRIKF